MSIQVPRTAQPGRRIVTGIECDNGAAAESPFLVQIAWPQFLGGSTRTAFNPYENLLRVANVSTLALKWKNSAGASPAVDNDILYIGSFDGNLYADDANKGELP